MKLFSTNDKNNIVDLREAVLQAFPVDKGLYMPNDIPILSNDFFNNLSSTTFSEIAFRVANTLIGSSLSTNSLEDIINDTIQFTAPVIALTDRISVLELFHGPTLAFKDFGARFMAAVMSKLIVNNDKEQTILVATSGDTGGAVASGFYKVPGIKVIILFPKGKVSFLQQQQLTTLGENISAIEIDGDFDDCQRIVKEAFLDTDLIERYNFSSANSINIARLIPQTFYYFESFKQLKKDDRSIVYSVPSGNLGNLTAGLIAKRMGLNIHRFIAAHNSNDSFHRYLNTSNYEPRDTISTISNAMDVGNPSNFVRIKELYCSTWNNISKDIFSDHISEQETKQTIKDIYNKHNYISCPHSAVGYKALDNYLSTHSNTQGVYLSTAHPSKFIETVQDLLDISIEIPQRLLDLKDKASFCIPLSKNYIDFKNYLLD